MIVWLPLTWWLWFRNTCSVKCLTRRRSLFTSPPLKLLACMLFFRFQRGLVTMKPLQCNISTVWLHPSVKGTCVLRTFAGLIIHWISRTVTFVPRCVLSWYFPEWDVSLSEALLTGWIHISVFLAFKISSLAAYWSEQNRTSYSVYYRVYQVSVWSYFNS